MEEAAGGEAGAAAEYAPWESAEEREEDIAHMGRILEQGGFELGSDVGEAAEVAAAVCSLCDGREGEVTGDCKAGNCETVRVAASRAEVQGYGSAVMVALGQVVMSHQGRHRRQRVCSRRRR